ncbi:plastocyanin/azurin family copper-binding protein [Candidatus Solirubrobacter pratensis]|uniref:plastocyanin/azurin family copper-binding protein n=1 Tax=Candidatus Solirubrobacter pratensis TaxID=1298857 RepID=UPI0009DBBE36|nr:plastocyanin/azurin family copper-binding protein [Candidatus Solirubrobacter pratensis]
MINRRRVAAFVVCWTVAVGTWALPAVAATSVSVSAGKPSEYKFTLSKKSVKAGSVTFTVSNKGKIPHDFSIGGKKTKLIRPGKSATLKVTLKKGSVSFKCTVSGHAQAGMKGTLKVT